MRAKAHTPKDMEQTQRESDQRREGGKMKTNWLGPQVQEMTWQS